MIWDWNVRSNTLWLNGSFTRQYGHPSGDVDLTAWSGNIHPDDQDRVLREIREVVAAGSKVWVGEYRFRRADGGWADVFDRRYVMYDEAGNSTRMIGAMLDMTSRHSAQREINELSRRNVLILNSAADGIFGLDTNGITTFVNEAAARMLGWPVEELRGQRMHDLVHIAHQDGSSYEWESCPSYRTVTAGEAGHSSRELFQRRDGSTIPVEFTSSPIRNGEGVVVGGVVTFRDITERRAVEKMKDEFVSIVSHELRTPLTSIRGALGLLASGRVKADNAQRMLDIAVSNTDRLIRLINDILDIERMESGPITLEKTLCNVPDLVAQAVEVMRPMAEKAHIRVIVQAEMGTVIADSDRIVQTLTNLISNAIKFSPAESVITVTARARAGRTEFEVADQGRGIPADKLELIFERFHQVDASDSRQKGGSGLGLAICRSIIRQHGGHIAVESTPGTGSRFRFYLPAPDRMAATAAGARQTILICDNDEGSVADGVAIAEANGYRAVGVTSGRDLLDEAGTVLPDVILLDLFMPYLNGWETLAALKGREEIADIPVVILSSLSLEETGPPPHPVAGWIAKPVQPEMMIDTVRHAIATRPQGRVLVLERDHDAAQAMTQNLRRRGVRAYHLNAGPQAVEMAHHVRPDLVLLELLDPEGDGFDLVSVLKEQEVLRAVPMIVHSAFELNSSQREQLRLGPTEFLTNGSFTLEGVERRVVDLLATIVRRRGELSSVA